jgi:adenine-specific DNA-methyltransferase
MSEAKALEMLRDERWHFGSDETTIPRPKAYLMEHQESKLTGIQFFDSQKDSKFLQQIGIPFDFPKPVDLIKQVVALFDRDDIILDFFAGSGTTAQAVLELNKEDGGNRKFIMVQLPEKTSREDYPTITDITLERTRRVIKKLNDAENGSLGLQSTPDRGFKAFTLRASNFKVWDSSVEGKTASDLEEQLTLFAHNLEVNEADEKGILFEIILKSGLPITVQIQELELNQKVYAIEDKTLYICLAQPIQEATLTAVVEAKPKKFVCLDAAFEGNDQLKTNTLLQMRNAGITFYTV